MGKKTKLMDPLNAGELLLLHEQVCQEIARLLSELLDSSDRIKDLLSLLQVWEGPHCDSVISFSSKLGDEV